MSSVRNAPVAPRAGTGGPAQDGAGRGVTLILPGPISHDGTAYRIFKPYGQLASALCAHFGRVTVCTHVLTREHPAFGGSDPLLDPRVQVEPLPSPPAGSPGVARSLAHHLRSSLAVVRRIRQWDVVYAFVPSYPGAVAYTANRLFFHRPAAVYLANDWEEITPYTFRWGGGVRGLLFGPYRVLLTRWERWMMRSTRLGLTAGRALLDKYGGEGRPIYETAPILEMKPSDMVRREDTCLQSPVRMLYVGTLNPRKGVPVLLDALRALVDEGRQVTLDVVGDGPDRAELQERVRAMGLGDRVAFHGFVAAGPELFAFYRRADLFVLPTYSEGFPRVLYEAMGHSLPVVASAVSGIPFLLQDGRHGLLVPPGDPAALAAAMRRVMDDGALRRGLIREGFALVGPIVARDPASQFAELCRRHLGPAAEAA
jgi:glycosyltransferase involved in cell wall biosynthesis